MGCYNVPIGTTLSVMHSKIHICPSLSVSGIASSLKKGNFVTFDIRIQLNSSLQDLQGGLR